MNLSDILRDVLPPAARKYAYAALTLAALVWSVYQASGGDWGQFVGGLIVALTGGMAASNTPKPADDADPHAAIPGTTLPDVPVVPAEPLDAPNEDYEPRHD